METYESDTTLFLRDLLKKHPEITDRQKKARATWWDKPYDADQRQAFEEARVPKRSYEYYSNGR